MQMSSDAQPERRTAALEAEVEHLRRRVAGLTQALDARAGIEQAKGVLAERHGWSVERAFEQISVLSQNTNTRVHDIARTVVEQTAGPRTLGPEQLAWACRLVDLLPCPAVVLTPVPGEGGSPGLGPGPGKATDLQVDHANPAMVDLEGRSAAQVVGRPVSRIWPGVVASGLLDHYLRVVATGQPYASDTQPLAELVGTGIVTTVLHVRALPWPGGVLVMWREDEAARRTHPLAPPRPVGGRRR